MRITTNFMPQYVNTYGKAKTEPTADFADTLQKISEETTVKTDAAAEKPIRYPSDHPYHVLQKLHDWDTATEYKESHPSAVFIKAVGNTGYFTVAEPDDPRYGLSGDELLAAIVKHYNGGRDSQMQHYEMMNEIRINGLISDEESWALDRTRASILGEARRREEDRLGDNFDFDYWIATFRYSILDYLDVLDSICELQEVGPYRDFIIDFESKLFNILNSD